MAVRYHTVRVDDLDLREGMKALAHKRSRFGYRRLHVLLRRKASGQLTTRRSCQHVRRAAQYFGGG